jgi:RNA polymerase sigma factor (sigma-70 family)
VDRSVDPTARVDESSRLTTALKELSPMRRAVVVLRFYEDMTEAEIARVLDRPLGTVKSDLHRALKLLRPLLESDLRSEEGTR